MLANTVKQRVMQLRDLPSLPDVVARVLRVVDNPRSSAATLSRAISVDPALTARVLRLANSALYGYAGRIGTVVQAVTILGFAQVRSQVLTISILDVFSCLKGKQGFPHREYWEHCLACAVAARMLARKTRVCPPEEAFVAGLLHDIGKIVLWMVLAEEYGGLLARAVDEERPLAAVEQQVFGFDHASVGGWSAARWHLPETLVKVVEQHHKGDAGGPAAGLLRCVRTADIWVNGEEYGWSGNGLRPELPDDPVWGQAALELLAAELAEELGMARQLLDLSVTGQGEPV